MWGELEGGAIAAPRTNTQDSVFLEWFYRSLIPGVHFLPMSMAAPLDAVRACRQLAAEGGAEAVAAAANAFAYRFLGAGARVLYWQEAMRRYGKLWAPGAMEALLARVPWATLRSSNGSIVGAGAGPGADGAPPFDLKALMAVLGARG